MIGLAGGCLAQKDGGNFPSYCWDKQAWMVAIEKCYTDQGLKMPMPPKDGADGKNRRDASLEQGGKTDQDWAGAKDGNWSKPDGDWGKDEVKATSAPGVTATKDGVTWVVNKDGVWVKLESLGRRDLDKDVDRNKDGNWSKPPQLPGSRPPKTASPGWSTRMACGSSLSHWAAATLTRTWTGTRMETGQSQLETIQRTRSRPPRPPGSRRPRTALRGWSTRTACGSSWRAWAAATAPGTPGWPARMETGQSQQLETGQRTATGLNQPLTGQRTATGASPAPTRPRTPGPPG